MLSHTDCQKEEEMQSYFIGKKNKELKEDKSMACTCFDRYH
jgi:hypothetical protein